MEATMLRGCLGLLVLLGLGEGLAFSQGTPPTTLPPALGVAPPAWVPSANGPGGGPANQPAPAPGVAAPPGQPAPGTPAPGQADAAQAAPAQAQAAEQNASAAQSSKDLQDALKRNHDGPCERFWGGVGFLLWWAENSPAPPPLVTTGSVTGAGALGQSDTRVLAGKDRPNLGTQPGIWFEGGVWLDERHQWGLGAAGFILERRAEGTLFASDATGTPLLARPITSAVTGAPAAQAVSTPGTETGSIAVGTNQQFWGWEVNLYRNLAHTDCWDWQVLAGFRYLDLYENLDIVQNSQFLTPTTIGIGGAGLPAGSVETIADRFTTRNQAYLGQVGTRVEWTNGLWFLSLNGKVGLGPNHERVRSLGSTTDVRPGGATSTAQGGLLAVPSNPLLSGGNFGTHTTNWFVIVPEIGGEVGVNLGKHVRLSTGYSFLYINSVARPGSQVNTVINPALVPSSPGFGSPSGGNQPRVLTKQDDFYVHGVRFMVEFRF